MWRRRLLTLRRTVSALGAVLSLVGTIFVAAWLIATEFRALSKSVGIPAEWTFGVVFAIATVAVTGGAVWWLLKHFLVMSSKAPGGETQTRTSGRPLGPETERGDSFARHDDVKRGRPRLDPPVASAPIPPRSAGDRSSSLPVDSSLRLPPRRTPNVATIRVFFGTDRRPLSTDEARFADDPTDAPGELALGWCEVSVPRLAHRIGQIERPTFWTLHVSDWWENAQRHFLIIRRPIVGPLRFWQSMRAVVERGDERQVLLFIHGYNVSFDDAVYRTAQLAFDLRFRGAPVLYSWPSNAAILRYVADKDHSLSTIATFKTFLVDLAQKSGARTIHAIAHSMGNNALIHTLAELANEQAPVMPHFRQIIMAAPDVDRREFLRLADAFHRSADRITLYAADNDRALAASDTLHGEPRVGDASPMFMHHGLDSIDASAIIKGFLKHSYFADERVLNDIERLFASNAAPPRFGLVGIPDDDRPDYWRFRP